MADTQGARGEGVRLSVLGMGGTIDKDYPRSQMGYAFEIDEPAAGRVLEGLPHSGIEFDVVSVCRKDSTASMIELCPLHCSSKSKRVVVTHGTDTMIETANFLHASGAATDKVVAFT
ncbi:MAG: hypothetical protein SGPRY_013481, partial [Prymnesium sp.]